MRLALLTASAAANAACALLNNGYARFYTAPRRANPEAAIGSAVLLAECRFAATAFPAASGGISYANPLTEEAATRAAGDVGWCALLRADGTTTVADCSVGVGDLDVATDEGFDLEIVAVAIIAARRFNITALKYTQALGT